MGNAAASKGNNSSGQKGSNTSPSTRSTGLTASPSRASTVSASEESTNSTTTTSITVPGASMEGKIVGSDEDSAVMGWTTTAAFQKGIDSLSNEDDVTASEEVTNDNRSLHKNVFPNIDHVLGKILPEESDKKSTRPPIKSATRAIFAQGQSVEDLAIHYMHMVAMVLALAQRGMQHQQDPLLVGEFIRQVLEEKEVAPLHDRPYPSNIWSIWKSWVKRRSALVGQDIEIHTVQEDAMHDYVYGICYSPSAQTLTVVLGATEWGRCGQRFSEYEWGGKKVGVDAYWAEEILGNESLLEEVDKEIKWLKLPFQTLSFCGYGAGGSLANIFGVYFSSRGGVPVQVWTYGALRVGDMRFQQLHQQLEEQGNLRHVRFQNRQDSISRRPTISHDELLTFREVGHCVSLNGRNHDLQEYADLVARWNQGSMSLSKWYTQFHTKRSHAERQRLRYTLLLVSLAIVYLPLIYVVWIQPLPGMFASRDESWRIRKKEPSMAVTAGFKVGSMSVEEVGTRGAIRVTASAKMMPEKSEVLTPVSEETEPIEEKISKNEELVTEDTVIEVTEPEKTARRRDSLAASALGTVMETSIEAPETPSKDPEIDLEVNESVEAQGPSGGVMASTDESQSSQEETEEVRREETDSLLVGETPQVKETVGVAIESEHSSDESAQHKQSTDDDTEEEEQQHEGEQHDTNVHAENDIHDEGEVQPPDDSTVASSESPLDTDKGDSTGNEETAHPWVDKEEPEPTVDKEEPSQPPLSVSLRIQHHEELPPHKSIFSKGTPLRPRVRLVDSPNFADISKSVLQTRLAQAHTEEIFRGWEKQHFHAKNLARHDAAEGAKFVLEEARQKNIHL